MHLFLHSNTSSKLLDAWARWSWWLILDMCVHTCGCAAVLLNRYEGVSPAGSHKPNTAVPQAYYNKIEGE